MTARFSRRLPLSPQSLRSRNACFTLIQAIIAIGLVALLAAILVPALQRGQANARRAQCDVKLKSVALALDAFKQENHVFPRDLAELTQKGYLTEAQALHCPSDPRPSGTYGEFYVVRAHADEKELPIICCPFHEEDTGRGTQARMGRYTTQFATKPAVLTAGNNVQVKSPGESNPKIGYAGMELRGGDQILTGQHGTALITFADTTTARLDGNADVTVLQSFVDGHTGAPLYSIIRQVSGRGTYTINHGSRFDVVTPTATAGARGTKFIVEVTGDKPEDTKLYVEEGKVLFTSLHKTVLAPVGEWLTTTTIKTLKSILGILF